MVTPAIARLKAVNASTPTEKFLLGISGRAKNNTEQPLVLF